MTSKNRKKKYSSDEDNDGIFEDGIFGDDMSSDGLADDAVMSDKEEPVTENIEDIEDVEDIEDLNDIPESDEENSEIELEEETESESESDLDDVEDQETEKTEETEDDPKEKLKIIEKDECVYNSIQEDDVNLINEAEDNILSVPLEEQCTTRKLTTYERVRILSTRAKQISLGAKPMLKNIGNRTPMELAELELKYKVVPIKIKRLLPNGKYEIVKISQLEIVN